MIAPEQLAQALDRLPPRDRELLSLSLQRRVPDEALAQVFEIDVAEVARRRARAIEQLADEMKLQRGEELGDVLQALLEPATWSATAAGQELAQGAGAGGGPARLAAVPLPGSKPTVGPSLAPGSSSLSGSSSAPGSSSPPEPSPGPSLVSLPPPAEPAQEARGEGEPVRQAAAEEPAPDEPAAKAPAPDEPAATASALDEPGAEEHAPDGSDRPRRSVLLAVLGMTVVALVCGAGFVGATQFGDASTIVKRGGAGDDGTRNFAPAKGSPLTAPFPSEPRKQACYSTAAVRGKTVLYRRPGGRKRTRIGPRTEWKSPRVLGVVRRRADWLAVQSSELRNGEVAWMRRSDAVIDCTTWSLHADLSKRRILVRHDGRIVRRLTVAVGRAENPTPRGRFTVTDKLKVAEPESSPYGCCVLALSGHQTNLPPYWPGGDRLAVHATQDQASIGQPVSLGCLRAKSHHARWLIETIPLGAPIFIRA